MSGIDEEGDPDFQDLCNYCLADQHCDGTVSWCNCTCGWGDDERDDDGDGDEYEFDYDGFAAPYRPPVIEVTATTDDGEPVL
jgi:hypothetical protein